MTVNGCKWLEKRVETAVHDLKWLDMATNGLQLLDMAVNGCQWLDMAVNGWKEAINAWKCLYMPGNSLKRL